jgi:aminoglycoside 6'-N-acetyltransferase
MAEKLHPYTFRPVSDNDLSMIAAWLQMSHMAQWWGEDPEEELDDIKSHIHSLSVRPYIIELNGKPIGYLQTYDPHLELNHPYQDQPMGTIGLDLSIGDPDLIGKGHGPRLIDAFARKLFSQGVTRVIIDPDPANLVAIRAYKKAGFVAFDRRTSEYGPALMMCKDAPKE